MKAPVAVSGINADLTIYEGMGKISDVLKLIEMYDKRKSDVVELHDRVMSGRFGDAFSYFVTAAGQNSLHETLRVERFFSIDRAMCALNTDFWNMLIDVIDVKNFMPEDVRNKWFDDLNRWRTADKYSIKNCMPVAFEQETVLQTAKGLLEEKINYFGDMVDGVFRNLSKKHFTNKSEGFSQRMIVADVMPSLDNRDDNQGYVNDLRKIVGLVMKRQGAENVESYNLFNKLQEFYGEWVTIDDGAIRIKPHKNRTIHIDISPDIADVLNEALAYRYPNVIPLKKNRGRSNTSYCKGKKDIYLRSHLLSYRVSGYFGELLNNLTNHPKNHVSTECGNYKYKFSLPGTYLHSESENEEVADIFRALGGKRNSSTSLWYNFDYNPELIFEHLFINGSLPDQETHQFYATLDDVRYKATSYAEISPGHSVLDSSAGFGDLLALLPGDVSVTAVDIHPAATAVLRAKGYTTIQSDFLTMTSSDIPLFDRVLINPPFSLNRWKYHVKHSLSFVKPGGKLVAVLPASAMAIKKEDMFPIDFDVTYCDVIERGFEGAMVSITILIADRYEQP